MVVVFGSYNFDVYVFETEALGAADDILTRSHAVAPGGKGGNQAVAAARAARPGEAAIAFGCVGDDAPGTFLIERLEADGVDARGISRSPRLATGMGLIFLDSANRHRTVYAQGANADVRAEAVDEDLLETAGAVLVQGDVPMKENERLIERAAYRDIPVILTLGPNVEISPGALHRVPYVVLNRKEYTRFIEYYAKEPAKDERVPPAGTGPQEFCAWFHKAFGCAVVVTLGEEGAVGCDHQGAMHAQPAPVVEVEDTVGAGDALAGYFATAIAEGQPFAEALRRGVTAGSLACRKKGAQASCPWRREIDELLGVSAHHIPPPGRSRHRRSVYTGTPWETSVAYCRAKRVGDTIVVSGTVAVDGQGAVVGPGDLYAQARYAIAKIGRALEELGSSLVDVVRTRTFVTDISRFEEFARAHREAFSGIDPAATCVEVARLVGPELLVEIEVDAIVGHAAAALPESE